MLTGFVVNGINNVNTTTMERRFNWPSSQIAIVSSAYDFSAAILALPISLLGTYGNQVCRIYFNYSSNLAVFGGLSRMTSTLYPQSALSCPLFLGGEGGRRLCFTISLLYPESPFPVHFTPLKQTG